MWKSSPLTNHHNLEIKYFQAKQCWMLVPFQLPPIHTFRIFHCIFTFIDPDFSIQLFRSLLYIYLWIFRWFRFFFLRAASHWRSTFFCCVCILHARFSANVKSCVSAFCVWHDRKRVKRRVWGKDYPLWVRGTTEHQGCYIKRNNKNFKKYWQRYCGQSVFSWISKSNKNRACIKGRVRANARFQCGYSRKNCMNISVTNEKGTTATAIAARNKKNDIKNNCNVFFLLFLNFFFFCFSLSFGVA